MITLKRRQCKFLRKLDTSHNSLIKGVYENLRKDCRSLVGSVHLKMKIDRVVKRERFNKPVPEREEWRLGVLLDMFEYLYSDGSCQVLDQNMCKEIVHWVSTS